jgi:hypothetical protein
MVSIVSTSITTKNTKIPVLFFKEKFGLGSMQNSSLVYGPPPKALFEIFVRESEKNLPFGRCAIMGTRAI